MKKFLIAVCVFIATGNAIAQKSTFVLDNEKIFNANDLSRIDSLLRKYHENTGNHFGIVSTDTFDIPPEEFVNRFAKQYLPGTTTTKFGLILLLSRKNQLVHLTANDALKPFVNAEKLTEIILTGKTALEEKRTAEGIIEICRKGMEFMDKVGK